MVKQAQHIGGRWGPRGRTVAAGRAEKTPWDAGHGKTQTGKAGARRQGMPGGHGHAHGSRCHQGQKGLGCREVTALTHR